VFPGSSIKNEDWGPGGANQKARGKWGENHARRFFIMLFDWKTHHENREILVCF
jgi:hypothetical protein